MSAVLEYCSRQEKGAWILVIIIILGTTLRGRNSGEWPLLIGNETSLRGLHIAMSPYKHYTTKAFSFPSTHTNVTKHCVYRKEKRKIFYFLLIQIN